MARSFNVSFNITGTLDGSLQAALRNASNAMRGLGESARAASGMARASQAGLQRLATSLNALQNAAQKFKTLQDALKQTSTAFSQSGAALDAAKAKMQADAQAAEQLKQKLAQLNNELNRAKTAKIGEQSGLRTLRDQMRQLKQAYADAKAAGDQVKMTALNSQMTALGAAIQAQQSKVKAAAQAFKELSDKVKQTKADLKAAETAAASSSRGFSQAQSNVERLRQSYQNQLSALRQLSASLSQAGFNVSNFASSEARLESEINRVNAALERQRALIDAQRASSQASQNMFNAYSNFQGALQTASTIAAPFTDAIDKAIEFEHSLSTLRSISQVDLINSGNLEQANANMKRLETQAKKLGSETIYKAQEIVEAQVYIARTGWDTDKIEAAIPPILKLAAANRMAIEPTADIVTNVMTAFGHGIDQLEHDADVMNYTVTHSNQTLSQFGEAMKYAAPIAKNFDATLEETAMMTKFMGDAGIQGSMAGTSIRQTLLRLTAPPKKASKAMEEYGITLDDANAAWQNANAVAKEYGVTLDGSLPVGRQFISVMEQIDKNMAGASNREKMAALSAITGINAISGAINVFGAGAKQAKNFTELLEQCKGTLNQTYDVMTDDTFGAQKSFESAWEAVQLEVGTSLLGISRAAYETFAPVLASLAQFVQANPGVVQAAAGIAAALAGVVVSAAAVKLAFAGWEFVTAQVALVRTALATLGDGALLGGIIGRLGALRAALFGIGGAATLGGWGAMFSMIATQAAAAQAAVVRFFASLSLSSMASGAVSALQMVGTAIAGVARAAFAFAFSPIGVALMVLALAGLYCYQNWDRVAPVLSKIAGIITGVLSPAFNQIKAAMGSFTSSGGFAALSAAAGSLANVVGGTLVKAFAVLLTVAASVIAGIIQLFADLLTVALDFGTGLSNAFAKIKNGEIMGALDELGAAGKKVSADIGKLGEHAFDGFVQGAKNVQQVLDALNMPKMPTQKVMSRHRVDFDDSGVAHSAPAPAQGSMPETPPIDTTATQAGLDAVGQAAQTAAAQMDGVNTATQNISQVGDALGNLPAAVQPAIQVLSMLGTNAGTAATNVQTIATNAGTAGTNVGTLGTNAGTASGTVQTLGTNAGAAGVAMSEVPWYAANLNAGLELPIGNLDALGEAAGGAVGDIDSMSEAAGRVAGALSAKASEIAAIHIQAPTVSAAAPAANAEGGIYRKGAFLTTFAEKSPEAAIPIERSKRATDLWTTVGQMLGILPGKTNGGWCATPTIGTEIPNGAKNYPRISADRRKQIMSTPRIRARDYQEAYDKIAPSVRRMPRGLIKPTLPRDVFNPMGTPTFPTPNEDSGGGLLGRLDGLIMHDRQAADAGLPPISITLNVTVNGNADTAAVKRGVEDAAPTLQRSLAFELRNYKREQLRRSFG